MHVLKKVNHILTSNQYLNLATDLDTIPDRLFQCSYHNMDYYWRPETCFQDIDDILFKEEVSLENWHVLSLRLLCKQCFVPLVLSFKIIFSLILLVAKTGIGFINNDGLYLEWGFVRIVLDWITKQTLQEFELSVSEMVRARTNNHKLSPKWNYPTRFDPLF